MSKDNAKELSDLELEKQKLELEERKQALESKKLHDELARIELAEKKAQLETKQNNKRRGIEDAKRENETRRQIQAQCNHHTGGDGAMAVKNGMGDMDRPTSIGAIQFLDGSMRLSCTRCQKVWLSTDDATYWREGVQLWQKSVNKTVSVVGGLVQTKQSPLLQ